MCVKESQVADSCGFLIGACANEALAHSCTAVHYVWPCARGRLLIHVHKGQHCRPHRRLLTQRDYIQTTGCTEPGGEEKKSQERMK